MSDAYSAPLGNKEYVLVHVRGVFGCWALFGVDATRVEGRRHEAPYVPIHEKSPASQLGGLRNTP